MTPSELTLECKPQSYSMLLKSFEDHPVPPPPSTLNSPSAPPTATATHEHHGQAQKLQEYVARLEEERIKIDAFKRELPLCMQLLNNAMEASKQLLASQQGTQPVLEEFIPLKHSNSEGESNQNQNSANQNNPSDKANWMTSAQLWSSNDHATINNQPTTTTNETNIGLSVNPNLSLDNKQINNGGSAGAFIPFTKERNVGSTPVIQSLLPDLALVSSRQMEDNRSCCEYDENQTSTGEISNKGLLGNGFVGRNNNIIDHMSQTISSATTKTAAAATTTASQNNRKQRRCWSPDLHRRFVNALQMLGGSQVATPKQIRELMQVDGLTNDEVKSHLQKYRLHTRRPIPSPQSPATPPPQLVVLGSIWVPPEYTTAHGGPHTIYGTHPTSPHYCTSPAAVSQELYPPHSLLPQPHPRFLQHQQQQLQVYRRSTSQQVHSSPESNDDDGRGDRSESIEDGKSDSGSWKDEKGGGEIGVEVRKLTTDDESNNGSEITLKFR